MGRVIILEGPDGSGKSTLAKTLVADHGFEYKHEGPPPAGAKNRCEYYAIELLKALRKKRHTVFDRFHLGECVYGPVARNQDLLTYDGVNLIRRLIRANQVQLMICLPPYEVALRNWRIKLEAGDDYIQDERKFFDTYYRYKALTAYEETFDYTADFDRQYCDLVGRSIGIHCDPELPKGMVGAPNAAFLIVGEKSNSRNPQLDLPFFAMTNSAGFLNRALVSAGYLENEVALCNAYRLDNRENDLHEMARGLPRLKSMVCLGSSAANLARRLKAAEKVGIELVELPHPQYWKRFKNGDANGYVKLLREVKERWKTN